MIFECFSDDLLPFIIFCSGQLTLAKDLYTSYIIFMTHYCLAKNEKQK
jgi:hypothetical protein